MADEPEIVDGEADEADLFDPEDVARIDARADKDREAREAKAREYIASRKQAYAEVFSSGYTSEYALQIVLNDLAKFSRAFTTRFHENERVQLLLEGRAEVVHRIHDHANLPVETLYLRYAITNNGER